MSRRCGIECQEVQVRHFQIKLIRQEEDIVLVGLKRVFNLDTFITCLNLSEDSELHVERGKAMSPFSHREKDVVLVDLEPIDSSINQAAPAHLVHVGKPPQISQQMSCGRTWSAKEHGISKDRWPGVLSKFANWPEANEITR